MKPNKTMKSEGKELTLFDLVEQIQQLKSRIHKLETKVKELEQLADSLDRRTIGSIPIGFN